MNDESGEARPEGGPGNRTCRLQAEGEEPAAPAIIGTWGAVGCTRGEGRGCSRGVARIRGPGPDRMATCSHTGCHQRHWLPLPFYGSTRLLFVAIICSCSILTGGPVPEPRIPMTTVRKGPLIYRMMPQCPTELPAQILSASYLAVTAVRY